MQEVELSSQDREAFHNKLREYGTGDMTLRCLALAYLPNPPANSWDLTNANFFDKYET